MASGTINTVIPIASAMRSKMLRPNWPLRAHLRRQHLQRQTTLFALAAQPEGSKCYIVPIR